MKLPKTKRAQKDLILTHLSILTLEMQQREINRERPAKPVRTAEHCEHGTPRTEQCHWCQPH